MCYIKLLYIIIIRSKQQRYPKLEDVVQFVEFAAMEANDPVFCSTAMSASKPSSHTSKGQRTIFSTAVEGNKQTNQVIQVQIMVKGHKTSIWSVERTMIYSTVIDLNPWNLRIGSVWPRRIGLCFNCLQPNHRLEDCRSERKCKVMGCGRKHTSFLHMKRAPDTK